MELLYYDMIKRLYDSFKHLEDKIAMLEKLLVEKDNENQKLAAALNTILGSQHEIEKLLQANKEQQKYMNGYLEKREQSFNDSKTN